MMKPISLLFLAGAISLAALPARAEGPDGGPDPARMSGAGAPARMAERLHLTDAQRGQLRERAFAAAHRDVQTRSRVAEARITLHELMSAEKLDAAAVRGAARTLGDLQAQAVRERIERRLDLLSVLTPEQRKLARESLRRGGHEGHPMIMRMRHRRGGPDMGEMDLGGGGKMGMGGFHGMGPGMRAPGGAGPGPDGPSVGADEDSGDDDFFDLDSPGEAGED